MESRIGATANVETAAGLTSTEYSPPVLGSQETHDLFTRSAVSPPPPVQHFYMIRGSWETMGLGGSLYKRVSWAVERSE